MLTTVTPLGWQARARAPTEEKTPSGKFLVKAEQSALLGRIHMFKSDFTAGGFESLSGDDSGDLTGILSCHLLASLSASAFSLKSVPGSAAANRGTLSGVAKASPPMIKDSRELLLISAPSRPTLRLTPPAFQNCVFYPDQIDERVEDAYAHHHGGGVAAQPARLDGADFQLPVINRGSRGQRTQALALYDKRPAGIHVFGWAARG